MEDCPWVDILRCLGPAPSLNQKTQRGASANEPTTACCFLNSKSSALQSFRHVTALRLIIENPVHARIVTKRPNDSQ